MPSALILPSKTQYRRMSEQNVVDFFTENTRHFPRLEDCLRRSVKMTHASLFNLDRRSRGMMLNAVLGGLMLANERGSQSMLLRIDTLVKKVIAKHEITVGEGMRSDDIYNLARLCIMFGILLYQDRMKPSRS